MDQVHPEPDARLTVVFSSAESALVALATASLDQQQIDWFMRGAPGDALLAGAPMRGYAPSNPVQILVRDEDADRARQLLHDLEAAPVVPRHAAAAPTAASVAASSQTIDLVDLESDRSVGRISADDLAWLDEHLEKESADDRDYYFDQATLDMLEVEGAAPELLSTLRRALGDRDGMELRWSPLP